MDREGAGKRLFERMAARAGGGELSSIPRRAGAAGAGAELSFGQQRLWFLDQLAPGGSEYVMSYAVRVRGGLDVRALSAALSTLVARHEVLRSRFVLGADGEPVQLVDESPGLQVSLVDVDGVDEARLVVEREVRRGFDLSAGGLFRAGVVRVSPVEHVLWLSMHHIVADGWSIGVLCRELGALYSGDAPDLPELPIQYSDFAAWQRERLSGTLLEGRLGYWREQLAGLESLELPLDRARPPVRSHAGGVVDFTVSAAAVRRLRGVSRDRGASLFMTALAAWVVVLARWSGQDDVAVGTPIAGRDRAELEGLIGFFVNTLVLRVDATGDPGFGELVDRVREVVLGAFAHQDLPFERLVEELAPERELGRNPLFQVGFTLDNAGTGEQWTLPGLEVSDFEIERTVAKFDAFCGFAEQADGSLRGELTYSAELFDRASIERMAGHLVQVLEGVAAEPKVGIGEVGMLTEAERRQILNEFNDTAAPFPDGTTIHRMVEARAARTPEAVAVVHGDDELTYGELNAQANRLARLLVARGVGPDTLVAVGMERGLDLIAALLGVLKVGGAYVPVDPEYPAGRLEFMVRDAQAPVLLTQSRYAALFAGITDVEQVLIDGDRDRISEYEDTDLGERSGPRDLAYVIYTSGSTGTPKGVAVEHRSVCNLVGTGSFGDMTERDTFAQCMNFAFDVFALECWSALTAGGRLAIIDKSTVIETPALRAALRRHGATMIVLNAGLFNQHVLECPDVFAGLREGMFGGESVDGSVAQALVSGPYSPDRVINVYGPTEATVGVTYFDVDGSHLGRRAQPIGRPVPNAQALVVDRYGALVPIGVPGELWLGGVGVARGYWRRPELSAERFVRNPFAASGDSPEHVYRTGDLVRWLPDGNLEFLGRVDHQVKIRGLRIELGEIETVLSADPEITTAIVIVREDTPGDKRLVAYCVPADAASVHGGIDVAAVRERAGLKLPAHMVPQWFVALDTIPRSPNGKIDHKALARPEETDRVGAVSTYVAPRTELETTVADVWAELLRVGQVGALDDFFELGGHSLLAMKVINRLRTLAGLHIELKEFFAAPTVEAVAARLRPYTGATTPIIRRDHPADAGAGLSFGQQRLWFLDQLAPGGSEYVMSYAVRLRGGLDERALITALSGLVARHEVLRSRFAVGADGDPVQLVDADCGIEIAVAEADDLDEARSVVEREAGRGFDLSAGGLFRAGVVRVSPVDHILWLSMHHIVADGWSVGVLGRELGALYAAALSGDAPDLPELPIQYSDFAAWQRDWLSGGVLERQLGYWRERLAGLDVLELPVDRPRSAAGSGAGRTVDLRISADAVRRLRGVGSDRGASLFMTALAAWVVVLARWSGQDDVAVGTPIAGRDRAELEGLIGFFVNTLVLRVDATGDPEFGELVDRVREVVLGAFAHQDLPFERLVEELAPERELGRNPLFQVGFVLDNAGTGEQWSLPGLETTPFATEGVQAKVDLLCSLALDADGGLRGQLTYAPELFDAATIERMAGHLARVLEDVAADSEARLGSVGMLTENERRQILEDFNDTVTPFPDNTTLHQLVEQHAARAPEAVAVVHNDGALTYGELNARANRLARHLVTRGVGSNTLVAVGLERGIDLIVAVLGVLKAGGAYVPLDAEYPAERLEFMVRDAQAPVLLTQNRHSDLFAGITDVEQVLIDGDFAQHEDSDLGLRSGPDDLAYVIYTSGSTGTPKGVAVEHRSLCSLVSTGSIVRVTAEDTFAQCCSFSFDAFALEVWTTLTAGATLAVLDKDTILSPVDLRAAIRARGITAIGLTAALFNQQLTECPDLFSGVREVLYGAEAVDRAVADALVAGPFAPGRVTNVYGPTECTVAATGFRLDLSHTDRRAQPIGRPIANTQALVVDRFGALAPVGVAGELWLGGVGVARGYWRRPELTAERFVRNPYSTDAAARVYRTGDLVRWLPDGNLEFLGRIDDQVKIRGLRIELGEIENVLGADPEIRAAVVIVREDTPGDKRLVAYCVPADPAAAIDPAAVRERAARSLPKHMVPPWLVTLDAIPLTPNGKTDRKALPAPDESSARPAYAAPRDELEIALATVWAEVLEIERVGIDDDFFELGGHSLQLVRVVNRLSQAGITTSARQMLQYKTIGLLADEIRGGGTDCAGDAARLTVELARPAATPDAKTVFLVHAGGGSVHWYLNLAREIGTRLRVIGIQAAGLDGMQAPLDDMGSIAARYWDEIRAVQPEGPCLLLGWSYGALVVHEMARQRPAQVEHAFLLEPPMTGRTGRVGEQLRAYAQGYREAAELWLRGQSEQREERRATEQRLRIAAKGLEVAQDKVALDEWLPYEALGKLYVAAMNHGVRPPESPVPATLFTSADVRDAVEGSTYSDGDHAQYLDYWREACAGEPRTVDLPGRHMGMLADAAALDLVVREIAAHASEPVLEYGD
ncbi:amino acid adenylation domain-containing protein [Actinospica sp. MGRD01-02]|uniref:Amino acid adenylation domain-containing protein n=1 Tax=Actinospica acidithermotolerans TaxID=2828514 RepID=A0A941EDA7_9ACTN|nr:non-ribosomal peptide synthetase [Actinospica acidithermotolerans]MBR7826929.1 amino acid adenylation domain-containing protein [Actinospica acidithermotolerans]